MKCPRCGAENVEGLKVCKGCWSSLSDSNGASAAIRRTAGIRNRPAQISMVWTNTSMNQKL